jgi:hypothetical protein
LPPNDLLEQVPLKQRKEYDAAWECYASACRRNGTKEERRHAYGLAREQEDLLGAAVSALAAEQKEEQARNTGSKRRG